MAQARAAVAFRRDANVAIYVFEDRPGAATIFEFLNTADCVQPSRSAEDFSHILTDACAAEGDGADEPAGRIRYITMQGHVFAAVGGGELLTDEQLADLQELMGRRAFILYLGCTAYDTVWPGPARIAELLAARGGTFAGFVSSTAGVYNYFGPDGAPLLNASGAIYQRGDPTIPPDWPQYFPFRYDHVLEKLDDGARPDRAELGRAAVFSGEELRRLKRMRAARPELNVSGGMYPTDSATETNNMPLVEMRVPPGHSAEQIRADMDYIQRIMRTKYPDMTAGDLVLPCHVAGGH